MSYFAYFVAAIAGLSGAGSLALFGLFLWTGAFGLVDLRLAPHRVLIFDAGLCFLFFVQHSVMVRHSFRARLGRIVPAYWHGVVYTVASAIALLLLVVYWQPSGVTLYALEGAARWPLRAVLLLSLAGVLWGIRSLGQVDAFGIEAFLRGERHHPARLTVEGPYRFVRHPFYGLAIVALWSAPVLSLDRLVLNVLFTAWIVFGAVLEERDLLAEFGEDYRRYRRSVPMLVPGRRSPGRR
jgi:protein-S-isoprenylcysteine O-methyltransferase Ste14